MLTVVLTGEHAHHEPMNKNTHRAPVIFMGPLLVASILTFMACVDPVGDAPRATVAPAAADTLMQADAAASSPVPAGATRYVFSQDGSQDGAMILRAAPSKTSSLAPKVRTKTTTSLLQKRC